MKGFEFYVIEHEKELRSAGGLDDAARIFLKLIWTVRRGREK